MSIGHCLRMVQQNVRCFSGPVYKGRRSKTPNRYIKVGKYLIRSVTRVLLVGVRYSMIGPCVVAVDLQPSEKAVTHSLSGVTFLASMTRTQSAVPPDTVRAITTATDALNENERAAELSYHIMPLTTCTWHKQSAAPGNASTHEQYTLSNQCCKIDVESKAIFQKSSLILPVSKSAIVSITVRCRMWRIIVVFQGSCELHHVNGRLSHLVISRQDVQSDSK